MTLDSNDPIFDEVRQKIADLKAEAIREATQAVDEYHLANDRWLSGPRAETDPKMCYRCGLPFAPVPREFSEHRIRRRDGQLVHGRCLGWLERELRAMGFLIYLWRQK
jgi:hypothetical protein